MGSRGYETMQMCKRMIKINYNLKQLRNEADTPLTAPESPHNELMMEEFPGPQLMNP